MTSIDNLKELDNFGLFKTYIKNFIINNDDLFRLIWFSNSNPFDENSCPYPDNPWLIFEPSNEHGCVLFRRKNDIVLSEETVNILVDFHSERLGSSYFLDNIYLIIRIITKGINIQELENEVNRSHAIAKLIDDNLNCSKITNIGDIRRETYKDMSLNEENSGYLLVYCGRVIGNNLLDEANS